ncbi:MAG: sigma factor-like helix-turn-helix DNA-binding protein [Candidatus Binataceae bacterium]
MAELETRAASEKVLAEEGESRELLVPFALIEAVDRVRRAQQLLAEELKREPSSQEIAQNTGMKARPVRMLLDLIKKCTPAADILSPEEKLLREVFGEPLESSSSLEGEIHTNLGEQTRRMLATLTPREEQILRMRFGIGQKTAYSLEEVGKQFALTRERIRQIEAKALRKLRTTARSRNLEGFVDPK